MTKINLPGLTQWVKPSPLNFESFSFILNPFLMLYVIKKKLSHIGIPWLRRWGLWSSYCRRRHEGRFLNCSWYSCYHLQLCSGGVVQLLKALTKWCPEMSQWKSSCLWDSPELCKSLNWHSLQRLAFLSRYVTWSQDSLPLFILTITAWGRYQYYSQFTVEATEAQRG